MFFFWAIFDVWPANLDFHPRLRPHAPLVRICPPFNERRKVFDSTHTSQIRLLCSCSVPGTIEMVLCTQSKNVEYTVLVGSSSYSDRKRKIIIMLHAVVSASGVLYTF